MEVPLTDLKAQYQSLRSDLLKAVDDALTSMQLTLGPNVQAFEHQFADYCQASHAVGVGNGTEAIALALQAAGVGPGDEVVTVSWTFIASIEAIVHAGATPIVADIDRDTYTLDPASLAAAITPRTRAVIPVHVFGHPADMDAIRAITDPLGIAVIEDAAQAHGALYKGRRAGSLGDAATFSFYLTKNLGGYGEGGMVTTVSDEIFDRLQLLRNHGHRSKYEHEIVGYNGRLDEVQAAMLRVKFPHLEDWNAARRACAAMYNERLAGLPVTTPHEADWARHVYHLYTIRTEKRDKLSEAFTREKIGHTLHYKVPPHTQPACAPYGLCETCLPVTAELSTQVVQLPMHPYLKEDEIDFVCDVIRQTVT